MNTDLKRIIPASVAAWFVAHPDVRPIIGSFVDFHGGRLRGCCGLSSQVPDLASILTGSAGEHPYQVALAAMKATLGLDLSYAEGFIAGWDGENQYRYPPTAWRLGHADGRAAYEATREAIHP